MKSDLTIEQKLLSAFEGNEGYVFSRREIIDLVLQKFPGTNRTSVIPSDYCYNMVNNGIKFNVHLFERLSRGTYKYLGLNFPYQGYVHWKETLYGEWRDGNFIKH